MIFEPIPSVNPMEREDHPLEKVEKGCLYASGRPTDLLARGQMLYLTLWENGTGRELAADHGVQMIDSSEGVLEFPVGKTVTSVGPVSVEF